MTYGEFIGALSDFTLTINIYDRYDRSDGMYKGYLCSTVQRSTINNLFKDKEVDRFNTNGSGRIMVALKMGDE